jgi:hypothetical protein
VVAGLLLSESRKLLFSRWLVFGGLLAAAIIAPYLIWQAQHGFPVLEFTGAYASGKTYQATPLEFLAQQLISMQPAAIPLWLMGLYLLFFTSEGRPYRALGWAYAFLFVFFMLQKAKFYWLSSRIRRSCGRAPMPPECSSAAAAPGLAAAGLHRPAGPHRSAAGAVRHPAPARRSFMPQRLAGGVRTSSRRTSRSRVPQNYADRYQLARDGDRRPGHVQFAYPEERPCMRVHGKSYGECGQRSTTLGPTWDCRAP